jgi:hypothetical protein
VKFSAFATESPAPGVVVPGVGEAVGEAAGVAVAAAGVALATEAGVVAGAGHETETFWPPLLMEGG